MAAVVVVALAAVVYGVAWGRPGPEGATAGEPALTAPQTASSGSAGSVSGVAGEAGAGNVAGAAGAANAAGAASGAATAGGAAPSSDSGGGYRFAVVSAESEALYRVREEVAGIPLPVDAVGRTNEVSGTVVFDAQGRVVRELSVARVNLNSLRSDESRRDNFVRQNTLQTSRYPEAVLVPTEVRGLPWPLPQEGSAAVTITGDLTIRDVTRCVEWTGTATFEPGAMRIEARTEFTFADFSLQQPRVPLVLSVEDLIRLEADIRFQLVDAEG